MITNSDSIEWDEPPRSPENSEFYVTYRRFLRLSSDAFRKVFRFILGGAVLVLILMRLTGHRTPLKMAFVFMIVCLGPVLLAFIFAHLVYLLSLSVQRKIRLSAIDIQYTIFAQKKCFSFSEVTHVLVEVIDNGSHRLIVNGVDGELCRLRIPAKVDIAAIKKFIPSYKIIMR